MRHGLLIAMVSVLLYGIVMIVWLNRNAQPAGPAPVAAAGSGQAAGALLTEKYDALVALCQRSGGGPVLDDLRRDVETVTRITGLTDGVLTIEVEYAVYKSGGIYARHELATYEIALRDIRELELAIRQPEPAPRSNAETRELVIPAAKIRTAKTDLLRRVTEHLQVDGAVLYFQSQSAAEEAKQALLLLIGAAR